MSAFDPPPYIGKLISAINDGAKSAQLGAVAFVFIGLFLLATSFSATDEDLLIGKSISISQLGGVTVPVVLSFGFMPAIFLALHLYTLIRFDLLMQNLRHFEAELRAHVPLQRDRDRCLQLLANTEFIQAAVQPEASFVFRWTYRFMLAVFPVAVLLLVQLGSLRLQSHVVNIVHHITILLDILLLIWFFHRQRRSDDSDDSLWRWLISVLRWLIRSGRFVLPAAVLGFNFAWCQVPSATATTVGAGKQADSFIEVFLQPVDLLLCPHFGFGCRYLSVPGRTLVGKVWDNRTFVELRAGKPLDEDRRAAFEPLVLQNKRLRFADLSGSQFFNVDLTGADLQHARLDGAWMTQAKLNWAQLQGALLNGVQLQGARLDEAQLQGAWLGGAQLQGASLDGAQLQGASLVGAQLQGASLGGAQLQGAWLGGAQLQGASLWMVQLQGASLEQAQLQGAMLTLTQLQGTLIANAQIWRLRAHSAELDDAQFSNLDFSDAAPCPNRLPLVRACPNPRDWAGWVEEWTKSIPAGEQRDEARQRLAVLTADKAPEGAESARGNWDRHPAPQPEAVAKRLGDLACAPDHAPHIARGIFRQLRSEVLGILRQMRGIFPQIRREEPRNLGTQRQTLAARMLSADCPGAKGLTTRERAELSAIAAGRR